MLLHILGLLKLCHPGIDMYDTRASASELKVIYLHKLNEFYNLTGFESKIKIFHPKLWGKP